MSYKDIFTYIEWMKEALEASQHMDYEDICTSMIHHSTEEDPFIGPKESMTYKFLLSLENLSQVKFKLKNTLESLFQFKFFLKKTSKIYSLSSHLQILLL